MCSHPSACSTCSSRAAAPQHLAASSLAHLPHHALHGAAKQCMWGQLQVVHGATQGARLSTPDRDEDMGVRSDSQAMAPSACAGMRICLMELEALHGRADEAS